MMDLTDVLGNFGFVQKRLLAVCMLRSFALVSVNYIVHFTSLNIDHWCAPDAAFSNMSSSDWKDCCIPRKGKGFSRCEKYAFSEELNYYGNSSQVSCSEWQFDPTKIGSSTTAEWVLVCDRRWQASLFFTMFSLGNFLAYGPSGYIADRYGRKPSVLVGIAVTATCVFAQSFATSPIMFAAFRFLTGIGYPFFQHVIITLYMEMAGKQQRAYVQFIFHGVWGTGLILQAALSLAVSNWRLYILVGSFPLLFLLLIFAYLFLPESPRWLLASKNYERAETEIVDLAAKNGIYIVDNESVMESLKEKIEMFESDKSPEARKSPFRAFFSSKRLVLVTLTLFVINTSKAFLGSGFNISLLHLGGVTQVIFMIHGLTGLMSTVLFTIARKYLKLRKVAIITSYALTGATFVIIIFISDDMLWLKVALAMLSNIIKKVGSASLYLIASEIFPTNIRGKGIAIYMMFGRVGSILGSLTDLLAYKYGRNGPMILFAGICCVICILVSCLPETQDRHLPDSVAEANKLTKKPKKEVEKTTDTEKKEALIST